ncbi:MAG: hypothetical protein AB7I48_24200, partial [Planctomycetaceae bacterium]
MDRRRSCLTAAWLIIAGCASPWTAPRTVVHNPLSVPAANEEVLWERTVDVLHDFHFTIAREN